MNITIVRTHNGTLTRESARTIREFLRSNGYGERAASITHASEAESVARFLAARGAEVTLVAYGDLTPAQRGARTRKANKRTARKAVKATPTGFMRAYLAARKANPGLTRDQFALGWALTNA